MGAAAPLPSHAGVASGAEGGTERPVPSIEEIEDALVDGDRPLGSGTAISALRHRTFRTVFLGAFASNIGTWMQNIALGVFAYQLTHSATYVAAIGLAQLGPLFLLAMVGGLLADIVEACEGLGGLVNQLLLLAEGDAGLVRSGAGEQERLELLQAHRERVRAALLEQQECLKLLDTKIGIYRSRVPRPDRDRQN